MAMELLVSPIAEFSSSTVPYASILMWALETLTPPYREVSPLSPVFVYTFIDSKVFKNHLLRKPKPKCLGHTIIWFNFCYRNLKNLQKFLSSSILNHD